GEARRAGRGGGGGGAAGVARGAGAGDDEELFRDVAVLPRRILRRRWRGRRGGDAAGAAAAGRVGGRLPAGSRRRWPRRRRRPDRAGGARHPRECAVGRGDPAAGGPGGRGTACPLAAPGAERCPRARGPPPRGRQAAPASGVVAALAAARRGRAAGLRRRRGRRGRVRVGGPRPRGRGAARRGSRPGARSRRGRGRGQEPRPLRSAAHHHLDGLGFRHSDRHHLLADLLGDLLRDLLGDLVQLRGHHFADLFADLLRHLQINDHGNYQNIDVDDDDHVKPDDAHDVDPDDHPHDHSDHQNHHKNDHPDHFLNDLPNDPNDSNDHPNEHDATTPARRQRHRLWQPHRRTPQPAWPSRVRCRGEDGDARSRQGPHGRPLCPAAPGGRAPRRASVPARGAPGGGQRRWRHCAAGGRFRRLLGRGRDRDLGPRRFRAQDRPGLRHDLRRQAPGEQLPHELHRDADPWRRGAAPARAAGGAISMDAKTRDAIIGGVVGGSVGVAGLVAGLAAGLTAHGKTSAIATLTTTLTSPPAWATLTSTTQGAVVLLGDAAARPRQALDVRAVSASGPSAAPAAALEPGQLPWTWLGIGAALVVVLSCVLLCCLRRKGLAGSAQGRCRKQARSRAVAPLSPEGASHRSSPGPPAPPPPGLGQEGLDDGRAGEARQQSTGREDSRGGARKAWDRLFEILDHDGDGRITQEDFARAPIAAVAVASALEGRQPLAARPAAAAPWQQQSFGSSQPHQQSFGSVAPAPHWQGWPAPGPGRPPAQLAVPAHAGAPRPPPRGAGMPAGPFGAPSGVGPAPRHAGAPTSPRRAGFRN
ncbi:unnamed protein product, partial [Prorocentrum cordatum]